MVCLCWPTWELIATFSVLWASRLYIGSLTLVMMGVFTLQKLANTTNKGSPISSTAITTTMIVRHLPAYHWALIFPCPLLKNVWQQGSLCWEIGRHRECLKSRLVASHHLTAPRFSLAHCSSMTKQLPGPKENTCTSQYFEQASDIRSKSMLK